MTGVAAHAVTVASGSVHGPAHVVADPSMLPRPYRVVDRRTETADTTTLSLHPVGQPIGAWAPGQFTMVYAFGVGEVPVSISGGSGDEIVHTLRAVGAVTAAITAAPVGSVLGLRGPYGQGWPSAQGDDVLVIAGGIGLAPVRPVITSAVAGPSRVAVLIGARTPDDLIFVEDFDRWRAAGAQVLVTVDRGGPQWTGNVGVVTTLLSQVTIPARGMSGYICGPEMMMRLTARNLVDRGLPPARVNLSLERNMRCGVGVCGHCQLGPLLLCRDGPVASFDIAGPLMTVREL
jgi:anaerobic sulfite reductase subunit B